MSVVIKTISGPEQGRKFIFNEADCFLLGRSKDAHLCLPQDPHVSRWHFLIEVVPPECRLTDLESKNGTIVNGMRYGGKKPAENNVRQAPRGVREVRLAHGDAIDVGDTRLTISIESGLFCGKCGKMISQDHAQTLTSDAAHLFCEDCRPQSVTSQCTESIKTRISIQDKKESNNLLMALIEVAAEPVQDMAETSVPGYRIEKKIGTGGMAEVYKACDEKTNRTVAIKTMLPTATADPERTSLFLREVEVNKMLNHKNIVRFYEYGEIEGVPYIILEYIDGTDLNGLRKQCGGSMDIEQAAPLMIRILEGLAHAHASIVEAEGASGRKERFRGIVHRDIKPQNILLARDGDKWVPKLTDFGISKSFESAGFTNMTLPGQVAGTPLYWPMEQIVHYRFLNPATDVFSVAAVFYELLTAAWVRDGFNQMFEACRLKGKYPAISDYLKVISKNPIIPLCRRDNDVPPEIGAVIDRALTEPEVPPNAGDMGRLLKELRYPDAGIFLHRLAQAFQKAGITI